jgi:hypothetical protein
MTKIAATTLWVVLAVATAPATAAEDRESANFMLPACKTFVSGRATLAQAYGVGVCFGEFTVLAAVGSALPDQAFCLPERVTLGQMAQIVIRDLEKKPERWHENFVSLAIDALHRAFPCR